MMQSMSYLIQNKNGIHIDEGLLAEYELENALKEKNSAKPTYIGNNCISLSDTPRKYPTMRRLPPKPRTSKYSTLLTRKSSSKSRMKPSQTRVQTDYNDTAYINEIQTLRRRISQVQGLQSSNYSHFSQAISQFQSELEQRAVIEQDHLREYTQMQSEIIETKKEMAQIICMLNRRNARERELPTAVRSLSKGRAKSSKCIIGSFMRDTEYYQS